MNKLPFRACHICVAFITHKNSVCRRTSATASAAAFTPVCLLFLLHFLQHMSHIANTHTCNTSNSCPIARSIRAAISRRGMCGEGRAVARDLSGLGHTFVALLFHLHYRAAHVKTHFGGLDSLHLFRAIAATLAQKRETPPKLCPPSLVHFHFSPCSNVSLHHLIVVDLTTLTFTLSFSLALPHSLPLVRLQPFIRI